LDADRDFKFSEFYKFISRGQGVFTSSGANAQGFFASSLAKEAGEANWPDIHLTMFGVSMCSICDTQLARAFNFKEDVIKAYYEHAKGKESFMQLVSNGRPHSRGQIMLRSSNPRIPPAIDPKYLDNEHDIKVMVEGIKKAIDLVENSTAFQKIGAHFTDEKFPGCQEVEFRTDEYWECFVRQYTVSLHHLVGTCSMASSEKDGGVVDTQLKVFGTKRLRVIDASVMKVIPVGNSNWPTIMIGEKGSEMIIRFWESSNETASTPPDDIWGRKEKFDSSNNDTTDVIIDYDLQPSVNSSQV
jgi:choline dehydrogenase-like flavoprotein